MVSFKSDSPITESIKSPSHPEVSVSKKKLYLFQIFHWIPDEVLFLKKLICRKKYLYNKQAALNVIRTSAEKERRYLFFVATSDMQLFDISTNKDREINIRITFKNNKLTR